MTMMGRREWLHAAAGGAVAGGARPWTAHAGPDSDRNGEAPRASQPNDGGGPNIRAAPAGSIEILFKAPGQVVPTGCNAPTKASGRSTTRAAAPSTPGRCKVYCRATKENCCARSSPEGTGPSGIGVDARTTRRSGSARPTAARSSAPTQRPARRSKHFTPGAGVIYRMTTDMPAAAGHLRPIGASSRDERQGHGQAERGGGGAAAGRTISGRPVRRTGRRARRRGRRAIPARRRRAPARTDIRLKHGKLVDRRAAGSDDLPDRPEGLDGRVHVSNRRLPPARRRDRDAGRRATSGNPTPTWARSSSATWSPARSSIRFNCPEGSPVPARHVGVEGLYLLDRRHRRQASRQSLAQRSEVLPLETFEHGHECAGVK